MNPNVDLRQLAVRREAPAAGPGPRRSLMTRYVLPGAVLLGFAGLAAWAVRDSLLPARPVTVVPVLTTRAEIQQAGAPLFQAAGWVEPRPTPFLVTALAEGVVEKLLVVEGQEVKAGEPVARLVDTDSRLALAAAQADVRLREAERASARAALTAARVNLEQPVALEAGLAEADAQLTRTETELANVAFQIRSAEAKWRAAKIESESMSTSARAVPPVALQRAQNEAEAAAALVEELQRRQKNLAREVEALGRRSAAARKRLDLKTDEARQLAEAEARVQAEEARRTQAQVALDAAQLRLERMVVLSPAAGKVLALVARPGMRLMGLNAGGYQEASTVVSLYDPARLQVRADVRLEDLPRVLSGQPVRVETPAVPGGLEGEVLFATSLADIQKNTLQVKVAVKSPPPVLKPDMLVQVTFLAPAPTGGDKERTSEQLRLLIPHHLVQSGEGGTTVWVADQAAGVARRRAVRLGAAAANDLVEVLEGLTPADKLIPQADLRDGERITVTGEDASPGPAPRAPSKPGTLPRLQPGPRGPGNP